MTEEVELEGLRKKPKVYTPEGNEVLDVMRPPWAKDARIALQSMSNTNGGAETATTSASKENEDEDTLRNLSDEKKKGFESEESRLKERRDKLVKLVGHIQAAKNELEVIVDAVSQLGKGLTIGGVAAAQATKRMSGRNGNNGNVLALERKKKQLESCSHIFKEAHGMLQRTLEVSKSESSGLRKLRRKWKVSQSPSSSSGFHVDLSIPAIDVKVEPVGIEKEHTSGPAAEAFDEGLRKRMESIVDSAFETAMTRGGGSLSFLEEKGGGGEASGGTSWAAAEKAIQIHLKAKFLDMFRTNRNGFPKAVQSASAILRHEEQKSRVSKCIRTSLSRDSRFTQHYEDLSTPTSCTIKIQNRISKKHLSVIVDEDTIRVEDSGGLLFESDICEAEETTFVCSSLRLQRMLDRIIQLK